MTLSRLLLRLIFIALLVVAVEVAVCLALTLRPSLCRSSDAVAVMQVPADACVAVYGPGPCRPHQQRDPHDH